MIFKALSRVWKNVAPVGFQQQHHAARMRIARAIFRQELLTICSMNAGTLQYRM